MLISLHLRNFRRHEALDITFEQGLNGLFGKNYAGKTAILLAIAVAIAGPGALRGFRLVRRGMDNFEVQLVLMLEGVQYRILRTKSGAKLFRILAGGDEKLIATAQGQVNQELSKLIGMPVDRWVELRFVRQKAAASMFEAGASKLNLLVEELTGVGTITQVIDKLSRRLKNEEVQITTLIDQRLPEEEIKRLEGGILSSNKTVNSLRENLQAAVGTLNTLEISVPVQTRELAEARQLLNAAAALTKEKGEHEHDLRKEISARTAHLANKPEGNLVELNETLTSTIESHGDWQEWLNSFREAERNLGKAQRTLADNPEPAEVKDPADAEARQAELQAAVVPTSEALATAKAAVNTNKQRIDQLTEELSSGVCNSCKRPFEGQTDEHRNKVQAELDELKNKAQDLRTAQEEARLANVAAQDAADQATRDVTAAHRAVSANAAAKASHELALAGVADVTNELAAVQEQAPGVTEAQAEEEIELLASQITKLNGEISAITQYDNTLAGINRRIGQAEGALDDPRLAKVEDEVALQRRRDVVEGKANKLAEDQVKVTAVTREVAQTRAQIRQLETSIADTTETLAKAEQLQVEIENLQNAQVDIENLRKHLRDNRSRYLQNAWDLILGRASAFSSAITEGHISELRRTEDGVFEFIEQNEVAGVTDSSGAQAAILGLAVQLSLAETLPTKLDLVLADEPTADMDADHSSAAVLALSTIAKQILVISHHRMDEALCAGVNEL